MMPTASVGRTLRALLPAVLSSISLAIVGLLVVRWLVPIERLRQSDGAVGNYLQTVGTIYAVLLAFVVFVVWTQFNDARVHVEREANQLIDLARTAKGLPAAAAAQVHAHLARYVAAAVGPEWQALSSVDERAFEPAWAILESLWSVVHRVEPATSCEGALFSEVLARFNELSDARTDRLATSRLRIPLALKILLYTGAATLVGSLYLFAVESLAVHALITGAMAGAISHVLYLIHDLDDCFHGDWQVPSAPLERVRGYVELAASGEAGPRSS